MPRGDAMKECHGTRIGQIVAFATASVRLTPATKIGKSLPSQAAASEQGNGMEPALTGATIAVERSLGGLIKVAGFGVLTGVLTPLAQWGIDKLDAGLGDLRIAVIALPFALLVLALVRRAGNPWWAALIGAVVTMISFVCAVNAAIWTDAQIFDAGKLLRNTFAGIAGGFVGAGMMALGLGLLVPSGTRRVIAWLPMLIIGTIAGSLLAIDNELGLDIVSLLFPVWQAGVAVGLATALQRTTDN